MLLVTKDTRCMRSTCLLVTAGILLTHWHMLIIAATDAPSAAPSFAPTFSPATESFNFVIEAFAGTGGVPTLGTEGDGGPATSADISRPTGLWIDTADSFLYFASNTYLNQVHRVSLSTGLISRVAGTGTASTSGDGGDATSATLNEPYGVVGDSLGHFYISEVLGQVVRVIDQSTGFISSYAGGAVGFSGDDSLATSAKLSYPRGLTVSTNGDLFIADTNNHRIRKVSYSTKIITTYCGSGALSSTDDPVATSGSIYYPRDVFLDSSGNLYIATLGNYIRKVSSSGALTTVAGNGQKGTIAEEWQSANGDGGPATSARISVPTGVWASTDGALYISDWNAMKVRRVDPETGLITTIAGVGLEGTTGDGGAATSAKIATPEGICGTSDASKIYVSSNSQRRIRSLEILYPTAAPTEYPTLPTFAPSPTPSVVPTAVPSAMPSDPTHVPTAPPTLPPTVEPTASPVPTVNPTEVPSHPPTVTPTALPTISPTTGPTLVPTAEPTMQPSSQPSARPSMRPSTQPSGFPTQIPSSQPTDQPSVEPTGIPSGQPTYLPSAEPSLRPSCYPTSSPSTQPTIEPSADPSSVPSMNPSSQPSTEPSALPSFSPTGRPSTQPSAGPTSAPTKACAVDFYYNVSEQGCVACPDLTGTNSIVGSRFCTCIDGYSGEGTFPALTCSKCAAGWVSTFGSACTECDINTYSDAAAAACEKCPVGRITPGKGSPDVDSCLSPAPNFAAGTIALAIMVIIALFYIGNGRYSLIATARKLGYVMPFVEYCRTKAKLLYLPMVERKKLKIPSRLKVLIFFTMSAILTVTITILFMLGTLYSILLNSLILWRGLRFRYSIDLVDQIKRYSNLIAESVGLGQFTEYVMFPFVWLFDHMAYLTIDYDGLNVTCKGSQASIAMLTNLLICGVIILFIESDYAVCWITSIQSLQRSTFGKLASKVNKLPGLCAKLRRASILLVIVSMTFFAAPLQIVLRYVIGFINLSSFTSSGRFLVETTPACDHIPGVPLIDTALGTVSSLVFWWMVFPVMYVLANIFVPGNYSEVRAGLARRNCVIVRKPHLGQSSFRRTLSFAETALGQKPETATEVKREKNGLCVKFYYRLSPDKILAVFGRWWTNFILELSVVSINEGQRLDSLPEMKYASQRTIVHRIQRSYYNELLHGATDSVNTDFLYSHESREAREGHEYTEKAALNRAIVSFSGGGGGGENNARRKSSTMHRDSSSSSSSSFPAATRDSKGVPDRAVDDAADDDEEEDDDDDDGRGARVSQGKLFPVDEWGGSVRSSQVGSTVDDSSFDSIEEIEASKLEASRLTPSSNFFPSYFDLCYLETNEIMKGVEHASLFCFQHDLTKGELIACIRILMAVLVYWFHIGHFITVVGQEHLRVVVWKYYTFIQCCFGYWDRNEESAKAMDLAGVYERYKMPVSFSIHEIYPHQHKHRDMTDIMYAVIGTKAILLLLFHNLTELSVYFVLTCGSPLFAFSESMGSEYMPPLYFTNPRELAMTQETVIMNELYHSQSRKLSTGTFHPEQGAKGMSSSGYRAFRVKARMWVIILTQGRFINYLMNVYIWIASMLLVLTPTNPSSVYESFLLYSLLVRVPYLVGYILLGILNFGTLIQLDNSDFAEAIALPIFSNKKQRVFVTSEEEEEEDGNDIFSKEDGVCKCEVLEQGDGDVQLFEEFEKI